MYLLTDSKYLGLLLVIALSGLMSIAGGLTQSQPQPVGLSGEGDLFRVVSITQDASGLDIQLSAKTERVEVVGDVKLLTSSSAKSGTTSRNPGELRVRFPQVSGSLTGAVLEIAGASGELNATTSSPLTSGLVMGPEGQRYSITGIVTDKENGELQIQYEPEDLSATSIRKAVLKTTQGSLRSTGMVAVYDVPRQQFVRGVVYFPLNSAKLAKQEDAVLEVTLFRELVIDRITLQE